MTKVFLATILAAQIAYAGSPSARMAFALKGTLTGCKSLSSIPSIPTPYSYWQFNETTGSTAADTEGVYPITKNATATFGSAGRVATGLTVPSGGNYATASLPPLYSWSQFSVSVWLNPTVANGGAGRYFHVGGSNGNEILQISDYGGIYIRSYFGASGAACSAATVSPYSYVGVATNTWFNIVVTWDGSTLKYYSNGSLVNTASVAGSYPCTPSTGGAGGSSSSDSYVVDEPAIWSTALTPTQVQTIFNQQSCGG